MSAGTASLVWSPSPGAPIPGAAEIGGKGHQLARLAELARDHGADVPAFVVIRTAAFPHGDTAATVPTSLAAEIDRALARAGLDAGLLAVRSSATAEDARDQSFAGQFETVLGVPATDRAALADAIRRVWASATGDRAIGYARDTGGGGVAMAVVLQQMVEPRAAGVAFAADPVTRDRNVAVVSAVYGLGEGLVSGELDADTWHFGAAGTVPRRAIAHKPHAVRMSPGGGTAIEVVEAALADAPALDDADAARVAAAVRGISRTLGAPQDIEWAIDGERLVLLQVRPITTLRAEPAPPPSATDPEGPGRRVWDNSNIIESYAGVTTPLTFTFARGVYEDVYRQFCRVMGVDEALIATSGGVFAYMLGLVRGRVYYNLVNWYRLIALLPGFAWNRAFMERMMGVREALEAPPPPPDSGSRMRDLSRLVRMLLRMIREHRRLGREVPAFQTKVRAALAPVEGQDLTQWPVARIAALYRTLERELLHQWRAPLVNDFFAMIFFGVLGRLIERRLPGAPPTLANDLLCGEGGIISTEPARRVMALARRVRGDAVIAAVFAAEADDAPLWARLKSEAAFAPLARELDDYIAAFGDRCLEELKLETITLREDPTFLLRMVRAYAAQGADDPEAAREREARIRREAEQRVNAQLRGVSRALFHWVLRNARARVRDRENLRFERTRVFGVVRRMLLGIGAELARSGRLDAARDVFHLTIDEVLAFAEAPAAATDLRARAAARRAEFERYAAAPAPPSRFETTGPLGPWVGPRDEEIPRREAAVATGDLRGTGCCPGVVQAPVRIVRDPREASGLHGHILVAERTDPGWTLLFPAVRGLLVERGSLLSHSAIVAREMGLPCVVGIAGLLETLHDGEIVEMDGTTGIVRRAVAADTGSAA